MSLERITFDFKGLKVHVGTERQGELTFYVDTWIEKPLQLVEVELEIAGKKEKCFMRYDTGMAGFIDPLRALLEFTKLPYSFTQEDFDAFQAELNTLYTLLIKNGHTRHKQIQSNS